MTKNKEIGFITEFDFDQLVSNALVVFTHSNSEDFYSTLQIFQNELREHLGIDTCSFYGLDHDRKTGTLRITSRRDGLTNYLKKKEFQDIPFSSFGYMFSRLTKGQPTIIRTADEIKPFSKRFKKLWNSLELKSFVSIPIKVREHVYGALAFGHFEEQVVWSRITLRRLEILCNILANAFDRLRKQKELHIANEQLAEMHKRLERYNIYLKKERYGYSDLNQIVGNSPAIQNLRKEVDRAALSDDPVLLRGEVGVGKDLFAWTIHRKSRRKDMGFVKMSSRRLNEDGFFNDMMEAFGMAYDIQADTDQDGGTLYIDRLEELYPERQTELLEILQRQMNRAKKIRIICATSFEFDSPNDNRMALNGLDEAFSFFNLMIPPLRERPADIIILAEFLLEQKASLLGRSGVMLSTDVLEKLMAYRWPGNVKELENVIERALVINQGDIVKVDELVPSFQREELDSEVLALDEVVKNHIIRVLEECNGKIEGPYGASAALGLHPSTLRSKMHRLGISRNPR